jgi:hypothetical protein
VLNDGGEVDLDLGNYERFLDVELCRDNNITTGKIFKHVIEKERRGEYDGKTVQMVPHRHQGKGFDTVGLLPPVSAADLPPPPAAAAASAAEATEQSASA